MDTGDFDARGDGKGLGYNLNIPLPAGTGHTGYLAALSASAYSLVGLLQRMGPLLRPGASAVSPSLLPSPFGLHGMPSAKHFENR